MVHTLGPVSEAVFALHRFGRDRARSGVGWHKVVRERLGDDLPAVDEVVSEHRVIPDLLWLLERDGADADAVPSAVRARARRLAQVVFLFCSAGVLPYWSRIQSRLETERDMRGRMAITHGIEFLLAGLHPKVTWESSELRVASSFDLDIKLDGRGLILSPSVFLPDKTCVLVRSERQSGVPALVFSTPLDPTTWSRPPRKRRRRATARWPPSSEPPGRPPCARWPRAAPPATCPSGSASPSPAPASRPLCCGRQV
ncbi:hypothetical protein [Streptomyces sp. NPDC051132]|uniref:hypothetical protein n=1 Tax=unclassified Streptomyces TaxID=2593676 RepID=UPI0034263D4F